MRPCCGGMSDAVQRVMEFASVEEVVRASSIKVRTGRRSSMPEPGTYLPNPPVFLRPAAAAVGLSRCRLRQKCLEVHDVAFGRHTERASILAAELRRTLVP